MTARDEPGLDNTVKDWQTDGKQQNGQLLERMHVFKRISKLSVSIRDSWDCPCSTTFHTQRERPAGRSRLPVNSHRCLDQILLINSSRNGRLRYDDCYATLRCWVRVCPLRGPAHGKPPSSSAKRANTSPVLLLLLLFTGRKKLVI